MIIVNKYYVKMFEVGRKDHSRGNVSTGTSEDDAIKKIIDDPFWYNEGTGCDYKSLNYPLLFKAEIIKN